MSMPEAFPAALDQPEVTNLAKGWATLVYTANRSQDRLRRCHSYTASSGLPVVLGAKTPMSITTTSIAAEMTANIHIGPKSFMIGTRTNGIRPLERRLRPYADPDAVARTNVGKSSAWKM